MKRIAFAACAFGLAFLGGLEAYGDPPFRPHVHIPGSASGDNDTGLVIDHGTLPTGPVDGRIVTTSTGLHVRVSGAWVGPLVDTLGLSSPPSIGDVTPNTGAFTTLSATGVLTVSGAGTSSFVGALGIGTTTPDRKLEVIDSGGIPMRLTKVDASEYYDFSVTDAGATLQLQGSITTFNALIVGVSDTVRGIIAASGHTSGSSSGGQLQARLAADHDTTIDLYSFQAVSDDLLIGPDTDDDSLKYDGGANTWTFTGTNPVTIAGDLAVEGGKIDADGVVDLILNEGGGGVVVPGDLTASAELAADGAKITTDDLTFALLDVVPTTINFGGNASVNIAKTGLPTTIVGTLTVDEDATFGADTVVSVAAGADPLLAIEDGDVDHGMSLLMDTNRILEISSWTSLAGGVHITAASEDGTSALTVRGYTGTTPGAGDSGIRFLSGRRSGTGTQAMALTDVAYRFANYNNTASYLEILGSGALLMAGPAIHIPSTITTDTTPSVVEVDFIIIGAWTAANDITDFDGETAGQHLIILGGDADCNVVDGAPIQLVGDVTWNGAAGATLQLISNGTVWFELKRSDAS